MAKKALIEKQQQDAQVQGAGVHPLHQVRTPALGVPQVRLVPRVPSRDGARGRATRSHEEQLVTTPQVLSDSDRGNHGEEGR